MNNNKLEKGDFITIDRFNNGNIREYKIQRLCRFHINVKNDEDGSWAMPNVRKIDIISICKTATTKE